MNRRNFIRDAATLAGVGGVLSLMPGAARVEAIRQPQRRFMATHYASPTGGGRHDGSRGNEWTLAEAYQNAAAGNRVQFAPGTYVAESGRVRTQASTPRNSGTATSPIVFFAEYPAVYHLKEPQLHTTWVTDGKIQGTGSVTGHAENVSGGHYVVWDGVSMRQVNGAWNSGELGVVSLFAGGNLQIKFLRCLFDQQGHGQLEPAMNWGAVFIQQSNAIEFGDCIFQNIPGSLGDENAMPFVTYAAGELEIHHCEFRNNSGGSIFLKGVQAGSSHDNRPVRVHHCMYSGFRSLAIAFGAVGESDGRDGYFCDVFQNVWSPDPKGLGQSIWWRDVSRGRAPRNVRVVNNTFVGPVPFSGGDEGFHRLMTITQGDDIWRNCMFVNNIIQGVGSEVAYISVQYGQSTPTAFKKLRSDYNCFATGFRHYADMDLAAWRRLGQDVNSFIGNPGFRDLKGHDFRLDPKSPVRAAGSHPGVDVLNLLGETGGTRINRGAYITPDMSDTIGIRSEAATSGLPLVWSWPYA